MNQQLVHAYSVCRGITRRQAKNFYWAFLVLPGEKRDAMCAVYAFMRHADDISDDPALASEVKHAKLSGWFARAQAVCEGARTDDPVLMALGDAQRKFNVPLEWLALLVQGTAMDVAMTPQALESAEASPQVLYDSFDELRNYCYHVASVVGLVSIRVFGYKDPAAEPLAVNTGIAFQLTNILRDVKEDAAMGRVYLPAEDLARFGISAAQLSAVHLSNGFTPAALRPLLEFEAARAKELYRSADQLLPYISEDARPALWALVEIYKQLLQRIELSGYDVFTTRVTVPTTGKLKILGRGMWQRIV